MLQQRRLHQTWLLSGGASLWPSGPKAGRLLSARGDVHPVSSRGELFLSRWTLRQPVLYQPPDMHSWDMSMSLGNDILWRHLLHVRNDLSGWPLLPALRRRWALLPGRH